MSKAFLLGTWSIAVYTWRESMRKKILIAFLLLCVLVIGGANFLAVIFQDTTIGEAPESDVDAKLVKDISVTAISIFGVLITIFLSASAIPAEVENKVIYTVLSKPVRRFQYLLGKFIGVQLTVILNLALMGALFFIAIYAKQRVMPTLLVWSVTLTYFEFLIVSSLTFAVSCTATSAVLPTISGLFIYITGYLTEYLKGVYQRAEVAGNVVIEWVGKVLFHVLPNLRAFSLKEQVLTLQPNDPPRDIFILNLIGYSLAFSLAGYILAWWLFRRKEF